MKLKALIDLSLILIVASNAKDQKWNINVPRHINASIGLDVIIPCNFTYPPEQHTPEVQVYWKKNERSKFETKDIDKNAFIFHTNKTVVLEKYRTKTMLLGDKSTGNCTLKIKNITDSEPNIYVRIKTKSDYFSFRRRFVSISLPDTPLSTFEATTEHMPHETSPAMYSAIFVPVAALLIILFVVGIVLCIKKKRSFTRQESGYYANFSRAPINQAKGETTCKKLDEKLPQLKAFDEHVYSNMEAVAPMDHRMDHTDNVYANVNYSK